MEFLNIKYVITITLLSAITGLTACSPKTDDPATTPQNANNTAPIASATTTNQPSNTVNSQDNRIALAKHAVAIFYQTCVLNAGDEQKVNDVARSRHMLQLNAQQKQTFHFEPEVKTVWGIKTPEGGQYYLATGDNFCSLKARFADMNTLIQAFTKMSQQSANTHGLTATVVADRAINDTVASHQKVYTLMKANAPLQYVLTAQASDSPQIMAQAVMNFRTLSAQPH